MKKRYGFYALFACAGLLFGCPALLSPLQAEAASREYEIWPDIIEISQAQLNSDSQEFKITLRDDPYTQEELDEIFHGLPQYMESGSFFLNRLNGLPKDDISSDGLELNINGEILPLRMPWQHFQEELEDRLGIYQGDWSVYIKDLSSGETMEINEHSMESASLIKLYIAGAIYEAIENETVTEDSTLTNALNDMIVYSDNESSNVLVRYLAQDEDFQTGLAKVNDFAERYGFSSTVQVNGIADPSLWVSDGRVNETSAADCGRLLEMIYNRELVSHFSSFRFEVLLNKQEVNYKIPAGLPEGTHISHKTGEVEDTENDAAIVYTPMGDYIFCILSTNLLDTGTAVDNIHEITELVHQYFTTPSLRHYILVEEADSSQYYQTVTEDALVEYESSES